MTARLVGVAAGIVRAWTCIYTAPLPLPIRDARRAEIESDLWEFADDAARSGVPAHAAAVHIVARLLLGIPDDLTWSMEHGEIGVQFGPRSAGALAALVACAATMMLWLSLWNPSATAAAKVASMAAELARKVPPPPPPPPR
jgi:hypothetical protein